MKSTDITVEWNMKVAGLIRSVLYSPDGKPPKDWTINQDLRIAKFMMVSWQMTDLEPVIRGLRLCYPSGKLTLKLLRARRSLEGGLLIRRAEDAYWAAQKKRAPSHGLAALGITVRKPAA